MTLLVARSHHVAIVAQLTARAERAESLYEAIRTERIAERDAAEKRYDALMTRFTQLRLQGFADPSSALAVPERESDPLRAAIAAKVGNDPRLLRHALAQLAADRRAGVDDMEILSRIEMGEPLDGVPA